MTLLDEHEATAAPPGARVVTVLRRGGLASWRFAARLARREVRRRPGRTALVMLLVAIPVIAMTIASVLARTEAESDLERYRRSSGEADLKVQDGGWFGYAVDEAGNRVSVGSPDGRSVDRRWADALASELPAGSRVVSFGSAYVQIVAPAGRDYVEFTDLPLSDPITQGMVEVRAGRGPERTGEVLLSRATMRALGVDLGDTVEFLAPERVFTIVGEGRLTADWSQPILVTTGFDPAALVSNGVWSLEALVDLPDDLPTEPWRGFSHPALRNVGFEVSPAADAPQFVPAAGTRSLDAGVLVWGWVAGALALAVFGIVVAAAFATSARRQLVTLGQLSANGADRSTLRRDLWLQGAWSGLVGSISGIAVGLIAVFAGRSVIESLLRHSVERYHLAVADLLVIVVTGTVAATVAAGSPARTISRVPTLAALGGRRPLGRVPKQLVPVGLLAFIAGVALIALVAATGDIDPDLGAAVAILGGLGVLTGACCVSPVLVGMLGPLGERVGGTGRLAARSLARTRTRSAAVVAAITATAAFALGASFAAASIDEQNRLSVSDILYLPANAVVVQGAPTSAGVDRSAALAELRDEVDREVAGIEWHEIRGAAETLLDDAYWPAVVVADRPVLDVLGLSDRDLATLEARGALVVRSPYTDISSVEASPLWAAADWEFSLDLPASGFAGYSMFVTEEAAAALGGEVVPIALLGTRASSFDADEFDAMGRVSSTEWNPFLDEGGGETAKLGPEAYLVYQPPYEAGSYPWMIPAIAAAALLVTLAVVGVGLALSAAEARDERDVLVAVGARPRTLRRLAGAKALCLAGVGCVLAVPIGMIPTGAVLGISSLDDVVVPWVAVGLIVGVVPPLAGAAAWFGSSVAQSFRPTSASTLTAD